MAQNFNNNDDNGYLKVAVYGDDFGVCCNTNFVELTLSDEDETGFGIFSYDDIVNLHAHLGDLIEQKKKYDEQQQAKQWQEKIQQYEQLKQELTEYGYLK